ncbi:GGDEF domain-containing protein [Pelotalea chapellei]|uniref:GGDEF domain-containing protein n=1 Tax=Pelotalea chapellei TaxID=44671 RepID=A0ABS5U795_9BACT|nr:diguanylate cyclase [Pelotalea chapellei]MBT1071513.1 GGDEF domain-containing protein [Pelotalea chapellei]
MKPFWKYEARLQEYFNKKTIVLGWGVSGILAVAAADYLIHPEYSLSLFYLLPVVLVAWFGGRTTGMLFSLFAALAWLVAGLLEKTYHDYPIALYWNDLMELSFFLIVSFTLSALKNALEQEKNSARTDHLTGISNRRNFYDLVDLELSISSRYGHPFTIISIDIDNFKTVNDTMGHLAGDTLLRMVAATMKDNIRTSDMVARLGGDEFAIFLPETGNKAAEAVILKVKNGLMAAVQHDWPVTFSIGMVTFVKPPATVDGMIARADGLMYEAKVGGKDKIRHEIVG